MAKAKAISRPCDQAGVPYFLEMALGIGDGTERGKEIHCNTGITQKISGSSPQSL